MKTPKRKRSSPPAKAQPGLEVSGVDAVAAEPVVAAIETPAEAVQAIEPVTAVAEPVVAQKADTIIVLAANCSVKDAAILKTSLGAVARDSAEVTLDASAVERVDTATMQLLCAFVRDRLGRNQSVAWRGKSPALQDAARLLGVRALLGFEANGVAA